MIFFVLLFFVVFLVVVKVIVDDGVDSQTQFSDSILGVCDLWRVGCREDRVSQVVHEADYQP